MLVVHACMVIIHTVCQVLIVLDHNAAVCKSKQGANAFDMPLYASTEAAVQACKDGEISFASD